MSDAREDDGARREAIYLLCGERLSWGMSREVFDCALDPDWVVKIEVNSRRFQNVLEWEFWQAHRYDKVLRQWLAPCHYISPSGTVLIQSKTLPLDDDDYPAKVPAVFTDLKRQNWGRLQGTRRVVCHDYAITNGTPALALRKADWWDDR